MMKNTMVDVILFIPSLWQRLSSRDKSSVLSKKSRLESRSYNSEPSKVRVLK